jgi:hypothetical protein
MKRRDIRKRPMADTTLASLEPETKEYRELDGNGLYLRVKPDGSKSWQLRYKKPDGKWSWLGLGAYGTGSHQLTGKQAREKAAELQGDASEGKNPLATKRARKAEELEASNNTFEHLAREWWTSKCKGWTPGTAVRAMGALELHVFPVFGKRPYNGILPMEWMEFLKCMEEKGIVEQTTRVRAMCKEIYDLARVTGRATYNPLEGLHTFLQSHKKENFAHVSPEELPALLRAIRSYPSATDRTPDSKKYLDIREKNNLLRIIKVLALELEIDISVPHKAAGIIQVLAERHGVEVPKKPDTIAKKIAEARDA